MDSAGSAGSEGQGGLGGQQVPGGEEGLGCLNSNG